MGMPSIVSGTETRCQAISDNIESVALEQAALSHILNAEGEKLQAVMTVANVTPSQLLDTNRSVKKMVDSISRLELILQSKLDMFSDCACADCTATYSEAGSAWAVGTPYGQGNAQYVTFESTDTEKSFTLGLGKNNIPIGSVQILRIGNTLNITFMTNTPYVMDQAHLYVSNVIPTNSAPGSFPYQYDPGVYFTAYTFNVDISAFVGETLYIAAHAHILMLS
ncbi:hypothetical protein [Caproiciproducens sp.]|uniref:hypothetical protein n=1 Tax=Caproiciproducens sp. TaxID=1954376 RepID=UPI00289D69EE|nr:hypothetical protein [Caproiciproducens sp.]